MNLLRESQSRRRRGNNAFGLLKDNNNFIPKEESASENKNEKKRNNKKNNTINLLPKKRYYVKFYYVYGNFKREEESIMASFQYFSKHSKIQIEQTKDANQANYHILLGKEALRNSTYAFGSQLVDHENIIINNSNGKFKNICMFVITPSAGDHCEPPKVDVSFEEFPVYQMNFNTNYQVKKNCPGNNAIFKDVMDQISNQHNVVNRNASLNKSGPLLNIPMNSSSNQSTVTQNITSFQTKSIILRYVNDLYYKLYQKSENKPLYIQKELIRSLFQRMNRKSLFLKKILFDKIRTLLPDLYIEENSILSAYIKSDDSGNSGNLIISQRAMEEKGREFYDFYQEKKSEFASENVKKYVMALHYIEHLKHRNEHILQKSNLFNKNSSIREFQNSYYLGFDVEYMIMQHLQSRGKKSPYVLPFVVRYGNGNGNAQKYILYYLYVYDRQVYLYEIYNQEESNNRSMVMKINTLVNQYMERIFTISFLSKAPMKYIYHGWVKKSIDFKKLSFLSENSVHLLYSHMHLFYQMLNPNMKIEQILGKQATDEMIIFMTLLLELS